MQRLEQKIDGLKELFEEKFTHIHEHMQKVDALEDRTSKLEGWRTFLLGGWAVVSVAALLVWSMAPSFMDSIMLDFLHGKQGQAAIVKIIGDEFFE